MTDRAIPASEIDRFLIEQIDTVPHLEALLLLWNNRPKSWSAEDMAKALFLEPEAAKRTLEDLVRRELVIALTGSVETWRYEPEPHMDLLMASVDSAYRRELIRISRLLHSKPPAAVQEFARAFRVKKDRD